MHLLTNADIGDFTRGCLHNVIAFQELNAVYPGRGEARLVDIVRRAKGVFLWTALVTNTLVEHLVEGSNLVHLQEILDTMPSEIEDLYDAIYAAISTRLLPEVSAMLQPYVQAFQPLDWVTLWLADEVRGNPAATMSLLQGLDREMAQAALQHRLSARTRDILESCHKRKPSNTAAEWISQPRVWQQIRSGSLQNFDPYACLLQARAIQMQVVTEKRRYNLQDSYEFSKD